MKKYPYSKQAMKLMLATALVATPFATSASVIGTPQVAEANDQDAEYVEDVGEVAEKFYNNFYKNADGEVLEAPQQNKDQIVWNYPPNIDGDSELEAHYQNIVNGMIDVVYADHNSSAELKTAIDNFRESHKGDFDKIFTDGAATTDNFIALFNAIANVVKQDDNGELAASTYEGIIQNVVDAAIGKLPDENDLDGELTQGLGVGIEGFMELFGEVNSQIDEDFEARSEFISAAMEYRNLIISNVNTVRIGEEIEPEFWVSTSFGDANIARSFNWYVIDEDNRVIDSYESSKEQVELTVNSTGDYYVVAKLPRLADGEDVEIARTEVTVQGTTSGGGGSTGGGDTSTPPAADDDDDQSSEDENTVTPGDDAYEDERTDEGVIRRVNADKLAETLEDQETVERVTFELDKEEGERGEVRLSVDVLNVIKGKNASAQVEIESQEGAVRLPVQELDEEKLRGELGLTGDDEDIEVSISVNTSSDDNGVLESNSLASKSPVVEFRASVSSGGQEKELTHFDRHVEREIAAEEELNEVNSVVLRLDDEGNGFSAAPTIVEEKEATFKSQSFSKYVIVENEHEFADVPSDYWAKEHFDKLGSRYIFQGRDDNTVAPGEEMRRAQFAALIVRSLGLATEEEYDGEFTDVDADDWFTEEIQPAIEQGIIQGRKDGTFAPNESVTRQQAAAMLSRAMEITGHNEDELDTDKSISSFEDVERIGDWAKEDVERLVQAGIIEGREDGTIFDPKTGTTRAQMAKMLDEYLKFVNFSN